MGNKLKRRWLSILLAATVALGNFSIPAPSAAAETVALAASEEERSLNFNKGWKFLLFEDGVSA